MLIDAQRIGNVLGHNDLIIGRDLLGLLKNEIERRIELFFLILSIEMNWKMIETRYRVH